ncbi:MAG: YybH family protein [bacterium]
MKQLNLVFLFLAFLLFTGCRPESKTKETAIKMAIETVLNQQVQGWNEGNIKKFMAGYDQTETVRFVSGGNVFYGWQTVLDRYKKNYPDKATMGKLNFSELDITIISEDAALVFGKWQLQRENDQPWGYFTLLFRKTKEVWRILHDHTSSA